MFKVRLKTNYKPLDQLEAFVDAFDDLSYEAAQAAYKRIEPGLRDDLSYVPKQVSYPIDWTSDKQRRYYFAVIATYDPKTHKVIPYRESGRSQIVKNWRVEGKRKRGQFTLLVTNTNDAAAYVYGGIDFRKKAGPYPPQQRFHAKTGWPPIQKTVNFWFDAFNEEFRKEFDKRVSSQFGFTVSRKRSR